MALHARYEQAWEEYKSIDTAKSDLPEDGPPSEAHGRKCQLEEAMETNSRETDALRQALLYQVPTTQTEALVLAEHLHTTFGLTDDFNKEGDVDRLAFETGFDTLLDFLFGESSEVIPGYNIGQSEKIVQMRRRLRTGITEAIDS